MLSLSNVHKRFRGVHATNGISFEVRSGEIVGLLGPNGAGKTTTLRCVCGILRHDEGSIHIDGLDVVTQEVEAKRLMAYIPEIPNPYEVLTVREHIKFVAMCYGTVDTFNARIDELLSRFELKEKEHELVATLSKGMKQKLAIACAFVHDARVFLCDEPMIGLDPQGQHELQSELLRLRSEGCAILVSTHLLDTAEKLCDRVVIMQKGRKLSEGTLKELQAHARMDNSSLMDVFLHLTREAEA